MPKRAKQSATITKIKVILKQYAQLYLFDQIEPKHQMKDLKPTKDDNVRTRSDKVKDDEQALHGGKAYPEY